MAGINIYPAYEFLLKPAPYKGLFGGRGGMKSWQIADALVGKSFNPAQQERIACLREIQASIKESVHKLLVDRIIRHSLTEHFKITDTAIKNTCTGADFFFKGLRSNAAEIKSTEGITCAWVEEAEIVGDRSWEMLFPTIRRPGAEIWASWNPEEENSATDKRWRKNPPTGAIIRKVGWQDNPHFPETLERQRLDCLRDDPILYEHIWEGGYRKIGEACIFGKRIKIHAFDTPLDARFYFGADWGFAKDPTALIRFYTTDHVNGDDKWEELWIDYEAYGYECEIDDTPALFDTVPQARRWLIKADCARPETISYMSRKGFNIEPAKKWNGSVEDGIQHVKGFRTIHIHPRCEQIGREARLYSYKVDKNGDILPIPVDKNNHGWDAVRYGLDGFITARGGLGVWETLYDRVDS